MDHDKNEKTRIRAHQIWEDEGRPHGRDQDHWEQARAEVDADAPTDAAPGKGKAGTKTQAKAMDAGVRKRRVAKTDAGEGMAPDAAGDQPARDAPKTRKPRKTKTPDAKTPDDT